LNSITANIFVGDKVHSKPHRNVVLEEAGQFQHIW